MIEQASLFINQLQSTGLELSDSIHGLHTIIQLYENYEADSLPVKEIKIFDVILTHAFLDFAEKKWRGMNENTARDLGWFIKRKRLETASLLDSVIHNPYYFTYYKPLNRQYDLLRAYLVRLKTIEAQGGLPYIDTLRKAYRKGDTGYVVRNIRIWLYKTGFLLNNDTVRKRYDDTLMRSVKLLQHSFGVEEDGITGKALIARMNVSIEDRMKQLLINLERLRWVETMDTGRHILINIPRYKLYAYRNDTLDWQCKVVVGTTQNKTSIFNGTIRYVVLNPYWNVPNSILFNEIYRLTEKTKIIFRNIIWKYFRVIQLFNRMKCRGINTMKRIVPLWLDKSRARIIHLAW
jgi:murein L,D-transpeptidase YcbB/YkuD